jgi:hypothetical protein
MTEIVPPEEPTMEVIDGKVEYPLQLEGNVHV